MVVSSSTPLHARSILPRPQYTPYGMPTVVSQVSTAILQGKIGKTGETIQSKIEELTRQVFATMAPLMQRVQQMSETIS